MYYRFRNSAILLRVSQASTVSVPARAPGLLLPHCETSSMTKRGPLDRYFAQLSSNKKTKTVAAQAPESVGTKGPQTSNGVAGDHASASPSAQPEQLQQKQQQSLEQTKDTLDPLAVAESPADDTPRPDQTVVAVTGTTADASVTAGTRSPGIVVALASSNGGASGASNSAGAAAEGKAAAAAGEGADAFGALMSAAKGKATATAAAAGGNTGQQLDVQQMQEVADRNQSTAGAVVQTATAAKQQPQLRSLLVEPSWLKVLGPEFDKPYMKQLQGFIQKEWANGTIYPPKESIFRAFNEVPFDQVRVVILGQDPYINQGEAMGLSFSVPPGVRVPPSLQNMYKELASDLGCKVPNHGCLEKWCRQGVLLLNASLTVRAKASNSHAGKGWEGLTSAALSALAKQRSGIVFLLWGKFAQDRCAKLDMKKHHVLRSMHPSPLSAHRGFLGCKHFSATNKLLERSGLPPIDWQIDNV